MADKDSTLLDSVPKIVITEPSPLPPLNAGLIQNIVGAPGDKEVIPATESLPATSKSDLVPEANFPMTADENLTSDSDASCSVSVENNKVQEVTMEVEDGGELLTPPADEEVSENGLTEVTEGAYVSCCRRFDKFSESRFMIFILMVLLTMALCTCGMGAKYMDKCPLSSETPVFLFMMGVLGILVILSRLAVIVHKTIVNLPCCDFPMLKSITVFGFLVLVLLLCTEMTSFLRFSPNFEPGAPNYCHRKFYNFTYWLNWTSLFVIAFLSVVHVPKCIRQNSSQNQS